MYTHIYFSNIEIFIAECEQRNIKPTNVSYEYGETTGAIDFATNEKLIMCDVAYDNCARYERAH
jgi:hypothetical protein